MATIKFKINYTTCGLRSPEVCFFERNRLYNSKYFQTSSWWTAYHPLILPLVTIIVTIFWWTFSFLFISREHTTWPKNNCLQIMFCSCLTETSLLCENGGSVPRAGRERFDIFSWSKERWSNDKTLIELGYRKVSWFVSISQINYLPQPSASGNNWPVRLTNHDILLNLVQ